MALPLSELNKMCKTQRNLMDYYETHHGADFDGYKNALQYYLALEELIQIRESLYNK